MHIDQIEIIKFFNHDYLWFLINQEKIDDEASKKK